MNAVGSLSIVDQFCNEHKQLNIMKTELLKINRPPRPRVIEVGGPLIGQRGRTIYRMRAR